MDTPQVTTIKVPPPIQRQDAFEVSQSVVRIRVVPPAKTDGSGRFGFEILGRDVSTPMSVLVLDFQRAASDAASDDELNELQKAILVFEFAPDPTGGRYWAFHSPGILLQPGTTAPCALHPETTADGRKCRVVIDQVSPDLTTQHKLDFRIMTLSFDANATGAVGADVLLSQDPVIIVTRPQD